MSTAPPERLNRFLARRGVASRRAADELIAAGRVTVNGRAGSVGVSVHPDRDRVRVDGRDVIEARSVTLALNKPAGVVTTVRDPRGRRTVMQLVPAVDGLVPVGRLDADSRGLLLLTTDGDLAHRVTHPRYGVRKRYRVTVATSVSDAQLTALLGGVQLDDGGARALTARRGRDARTLELTMGEGRKREVRRMCAAVRLEVRDLMRTAIGPVTLGGLREGEVRGLAPREESGLREAVGLVSR